MRFSEINIVFHLSLSYMLLGLFIPLCSKFPFTLPSLIGMVLLVLFWPEFALLSEINLFESYKILSLILEREAENI